MAIITRTENELKKIYQQIEKAANKIGLYTNTDKTKYLIISPNEHKRNRPKIVIGNKEFGCVDTFKYLGFLIDNQNRMVTAIKDRIQLGNRAYHANIPLLKNKLISRKQKLKIYKTLIRPIVTYGSETWTLTKENELRLRVFERKIVRKIYGPVERNNEWRIRTNEEINNILENEDLVRYIKAQRLRWLGHVERMGDDRLTKKILEEKIFSSRRRGRPKQRWMKDVMKNLQIMKVKR